MEPTSMYLITLLRDGTWLVACDVQDGTERWTEENLPNATMSLVRAAKTLNHVEISLDDIKFYIEELKVVETTEWREFTPNELKGLIRR